MLNETEINSFAKKITKYLSEDGDVELLHTATEIEGKIADLLSGNMEEERKINGECDKIMDQYAREIDKGSVDPHQMFLMIKKKLVKEKGFIL